MHIYAYVCVCEIKDSVDIILYLNKQRKTALEKKVEF